jgi:hypothetical protein
MLPCVCGHSYEEHGKDRKYPGSLACTECGCIHYEPDYDHDVVPSLLWRLLMSIVLSSAAIVTM